MESTPALRSAERAFSWLALLAPRRVWVDEVRDALEVIAAMEASGRSPLQIRMKICTTFVWVFLNGLRELVAGLTGRRSPHQR